MSVARVFLLSLAALLLVIGCSVASADDDGLSEYRRWSDSQLAFFYPSVPKRWDEVRKPPAREDLMYLMKHSVPSPAYSEWYARLPLIFDTQIPELAISGSEEFLGGFGAVDLDIDGDLDVVYTGGSPGIEGGYTYVWLRTAAGLQLLMQDAGAVERVAIGPSATTLVLRSWMCCRSNDAISWAVDIPKDAESRGVTRRDAQFVVWAQKFPGSAERVAAAPITVSVDNCRLRYSPEVLEGNPTDSLHEVNGMDGNVIASFPHNSEGMRLARRAGWSFVALTMSKDVISTQIWYHSAPGRIVDPNLLKKFSDVLITGWMSDSCIEAA